METAEKLEAQQAKNARKATVKKKVVVKKKCQKKRQREKHRAVTFEEAFQKWVLPGSVKRAEAEALRGRAERSSVWKTSVIYQRYKDRGLV